MKYLRTSLLMILASGLSVVAGILHEEPKKDPDREKIDALVTQLSHNKYANRELARKGLEEIGEKALPAVRQLESSRDIDLSTLARRVARSIMVRSSKSKTTNMEFAVIDESRFEMGSPRSERNRRTDEVLHTVEITKAYLLGRYEVTQEEFSTVMKFNPSWASTTGDGNARVVGINTSQFPIENVTWYDALEFCNRLSKLDGYVPYYRLEKVQKAKDTIQNATVTVLGGNGYRLPTEAEWELACRAWTTTAFHFGHENAGGDANTRPGPAYGYGGGPNWNALNRPAKVGSYKPNTLGLFDMHGNVAEWCFDYYDKDYYSASPAKDPNGSEKGTQRVLRGGSWLVVEGSCRSATRFYMSPGECKEYSGFRVARTP